MNETLEQLESDGKVKQTDTSVNAAQVAYEAKKYLQAKENLEKDGSLFKKEVSAPASSQPRISGRALSPKIKPVASKGPVSRDIQNYYAYAFKEYQKSKDDLKKKSLFQDKKEDYLTQEEKEKRSLVFPKVGRMQVIEKALGEFELALALGIGYLAGDTRYEINFTDSGVTGKSELIFPFNDWLGGGNILLGYYPLYVNFQGWTNITKRTNCGMIDKDWTDDELVSYTESDNEALIRILDANLLFNFWQGDRPLGDVANKFKKGRFGLLVGYKYENFKYDIIGIRDVLTDIRVGEYEVTYRIPYLGLNLQYSNDIVDKVLDSWGFNLQACGSPYVKAKDKDYHLLRNKLMEGDTKGEAFLLGLSMFFKTKINWIWRLGFDYTDIRTKGKQSQYWYGDDPVTDGFDDTGARIDGIDLGIRSSQYLFWGFMQYNF
jgi:outer membrane protease